MMCVAVAPVSLQEKSLKLAAFKMLQGKKVNVAVKMELLNGPRSFL